MRWLQSWRCDGVSDGLPHFGRRNAVRDEVGCMIGPGPYRISRWTL